MRVLPMFPLGSVLVPGMVLPLHVFEERYRRLTTDCLAGDREFGVVLIERGSEVGGGDLRTAVGTVAEIVEAARFPDGRLALGCLGRRRIRVTRWLDDDPYPRAEVEDWPDEDDEVAQDPEGPLGDRARATLATLRRVLALAAELGDQVAPANLELADAPALLSFQAVAIGPFGPADRYALLAAPGTGDRLARLEALLHEEERFLLRRLALDDAGGDDEATDGSA